jgi:hypothetical protein
VQRDCNKLRANFLNEFSLSESSVLADMVVVEHGTYPSQFHRRKIPIDRFCSHR